MIQNQVVQGESSQPMKWLDIPFEDETVIYNSGADNAIIVIQDVDASESACVFVDFPNTIITNPGGSNISLSEVDFDNKRIMFQFSPGSVVAAHVLENSGISIS